MGPAHPKTIAVILLLGVFAAAGATTLSVGRRPTAENARAINDSVRAISDSLVREACRGGTLSSSLLTCSGSNVAPRKTEIRRLAFRQRELLRKSDAILALPVPIVVVHDTTFAHDTVNVETILFGPPLPAGACGPPDCPYSIVQITTNSDSMWFPKVAGDTVTLCAVIQRPIPGGNLGVREVAWPPVRIRTTLHGDSVVSWGTRSGNPLSSMCKKAMDHFGIATADSVSAPKVEWHLFRFAYRGGQIVRPVAGQPAPQP